MDAFRTPAPLPVDLPITSRISVNAQHDEHLLTRNEDQQTLRAYVPDPNLPWDPDTYCAPCKALAQCGAVQAKQARVRRARVAAKAGPALVVGYVVRVPLAKEDRGKVDPRFLTCVVSEDAFGLDELGQRTLDLLFSFLTAQTLKSYANRLSRFAEFCHDSDNMSPLKATTATVVRYVAWIGERGHNGAKSLQPYLSAINTFFELHNLDPIAKDSLATPYGS
eukprot:jgi/Tetstr1/446824/TSEL_034304.t1